MLANLSDPHVEMAFARRLIAAPVQTLEEARLALPTLEHANLVRLAIVLAEAGAVQARRFLIELWADQLQSLRRHVPPVPPWQLLPWKGETPEQEFLAAAAEIVEADWTPDEVVILLPTALTDRDSLIRAAAADIAAVWGGNGKGTYPRRLEHALIAALGDEDPFVRQAGAWALAPVKTAGALSPLRACTDDPEGRVRAPAIAALCRMADAGARNRVLRALDDPHPWVRVAALHGLEVHAPDVARAEAAKHMRDQDEWVRRCAAGVVARLGPLD